MIKTKDLLLAFKGAAMGVAEVIPGVSGGTIAFITGIYERLLRAIKSVDMVFFRMLLSGRWRELWKHLDGGFLAVLLAGMACGVVVGVFGVSYLMEHEREILYAFFFGLILASAWYVGRKVQKWALRQIAAGLIGVCVAWLVTVISPAEGSSTALYIAMSGFLAVSALMLPGISGSFILLLLGMYPVIIGAVKDLLSGTGMDTLWIVLCFIGGMIGGLMAFSRVLTWMFRHFHEATLALLAGFMVGSLGKIWPWRLPVQWVNHDGSPGMSGMPGPDARVLVEKLVMPEEYISVAEPHTTGVLISIATGIALIGAAMVLEKRMHPVKS